MTSRDQERAPGQDEEHELPDQPEMENEGEHPDQSSVRVVEVNEAAGVSPNADEGESPDIPDELAILPLRNVVAYPLMWIPLTVGQARSIRLVDDVVVNKKMIGLVTSRDPEIEEPAPDQLYTMGTAAVVHRMLKAPDGTMRLVVQCIERIRIKEYLQEEPYLVARVEAAADVIEKSVEIDALSRNATDLFRQLISLVPQLPDELVMTAMNMDDARGLAYLIASSIRMEIAEAQAVLEIDSLREKLLKLTIVLNRELEVLELGRKIQSDAQGEMEKMQREYYLREQLKAIQKELGEDDPQQAEIVELERKIAEAGLPEEAAREAERELDRMRRMPPAAAEYSVIKTYLDWLTGLPWNVSTEDNLDIRRAAEVLDEDHYDLKDVKERIIEYLAVRKLRGERAAEAEAGDSADDLPVDHIRREREGVILCFVGPPGVGKTSLGQSIARALGRKFIRMSLGGVRDEAEIRGHRRTYVGALPGRVIQAIRRVDSKNPVFMLDEVDKLGMDFRGDPASALLEVLDPEQNSEFRDHYLDVPFDLSKVMFITTANLLEPIPAPLRDRMEILQLSGYTDEDKLHIARQYLLARQTRENGLRAGEIQMTDAAFLRIIREYTREAGVRTLERQIGAICRKVATRVAAGEGGDVVVDVDDVSSYLGKPRYFYEIAERTEKTGVATGLAVTSVGGDILFVEATRMPGSKGFLVTGQLGDVMKESAQAALSYVRSKANQLHIEQAFFDKSDIHLHIPAGATPKDGPSAGVTMATAVASLLTGRPVRSDVAMTGEITLRGQVLPVGGIKEKVLAASRAGVPTVILPRRNEPDLDDLTDDVREKMHFILVDEVDQVFEAALAAEATQPASEEPAGGPA
jgi:ATP-dependent Lon protease